ncbi:MAG: pyridoxamine 5'-phosphate oxidase [Gemmatimonadetes bacterium]|nr:pyridoxamine 5'-phosphate oxidase family protein [Gemmatimonadota bacterium]NNF13759.1 pyridoxamine 5'-phosphate oxidase [Gemmatimonadota bacterium]NNL29896.1 pyridoxamine 5'-phosphate oxidase [Gemmatimonadota bacterium]
MQKLSDILEEVWTALTIGSTTSRDPFHTPTVATVRHGKPVSRTVVLRFVDPALSVLGFNTDLRSAKCQDLENNPAIAWHFYGRGRKVQLRIRGTASIHSDDDVARAAWDEVTPLGRRCYGQSPGPGTPTERAGIALPDLADLESDDPSVLALCRSNFGTVRCTVEEIEWLHLRFQGHQRALFNRADSAWTGRWVAP